MLKSCYTLLFCALFFGCARLSTPPEPDARNSGESRDLKSVDGNFEKIADEYIRGYLAWRPLTGTTLGFHEYDGKITDFSQASLNSELNRLKQFQTKLDSLDFTKLNTGNSYDFRILKNAINREIFAFEQAEIYKHNPMTYAGVVDVSVYVKRNFAPIESRVQSITAILKQTPNIISAAKANLIESLPQPQIETAIEQANGTADFLKKDLLEALKDVKDSPMMTELRSTNEMAIKELRGYATWLKETKLPRATQNFALGTEKYRKLLQYGEMLNLSPEQILEIGMRELKRKQSVFEETAKIIDPTKKAIDVFKEIQKDHPTEKGLIPDTARNMEMIRKFVVDHHLITIPSPVRATVTETPQFLRATSFASMDTPGPFEKKSTEAYYYVTPVEPDWPAQQKEEWLTAFNYYTTDIVSIHEAYPGHYVQFLCLNSSPANKLEKIFNSYAFVEGWAHYAEQMMVDEGFAGNESNKATSESRLKAAKYLLAQTDEALLRLCRLCVAIKMHCQGMTVDQGTKFFQENCYYEEKPARQESIRGTFDPEYLYYTVGKLEILKLRADYQAQEGAKFSLQKFHDEMLRHGAPPILLLREKMLKNSALWPKTL